jgi:hypothetical protein
MKKALTFILAAAFAVPALAQQNPQAYFMVRYDLDATSMTFCRSLGKGGPGGEPLAGVGSVTNAASSPTITGSDLTLDSFAAISAGDLILIHDGSTGTTYHRTVLEKTDNDNVNLDESVDLGGGSFNWTYRDHDCGTANGDGWVDASGLDNLSVALMFRNIASDGSGIDVRVEGTLDTPDGTTKNRIQLWPDKDPAAANSVQIFTSEGVISNMIVNITAPISKLRVGMNFTVADDGSDGVNDSEQLTAVLYGSKVN